MILRLAQADVVQLLVSPQVLAELERALRRRAPTELGRLALLLERSAVEVVSTPCEDAVRKWQGLTHHAGDAWIVAAACSSDADYLVTLDREHLLDNAALAQAVPFPIATPGDFLAWYRKRLKDAQ
jgi:predicted nucleic acid-binding protein